MNNLEKINNKIKENPRLLAVLKDANETGQLVFNIQDGSEEEGSFSSDITGVYMPDNLFDFFKNLYLSIKESISQKFSIIDAMSFLPKTIPWSGWVWCIDSFLSIKHAVAMKKYREKNNKKKYDEVFNSVCPVEVANYLSELYYDLGNGLFVGKHDPSLIVYDESLKPFNKEKGWSQKQMGEILEIWYEKILSKKTKAVYERQIEW